VTRVHGPPQVAGRVAVQFVREGTQAAALPGLQPGLRLVAVVNSAGARTEAAGAKCPWPVSPRAASLRTIVPGFE
jgi:hypothetical protein